LIGLGVIVVLVLVLVVSSIKLIRQSTVGIVERLGKFYKKAETGLNVIVPFLDRVVEVVDLREQVADFDPQPVITKDNVTMHIDTVVYYRVTDPVNYRYEIQNPVSAIENLTATTLRNVIGELELDETLNSRDTINTKLRAILDEATDPWGIKVSRVELKNINPPEDVKDAMEKQMRAEREKRAQILDAEGDRQASITRAEGEREAAIRRAEGQKQSEILRAEGEAAAIRLQAEAKADAIRRVFAAIRESHPDERLVQIKYLEALEKIADGKAAKVFLPYESAGFLGLAGALKEMFKDVPDSEQKEEQEQQKPVHYRIQAPHGESPGHGPQGGVDENEASDEEPGGDDI